MNFGVRVLREKIINLLNIKEIWRLKITMEQLLEELFNSQSV